jgi:uncharacterized RDD family membrane protein YckC
MLYKKRETIIEDGEYVLAPFWRRFFAFQTDFVVICILYFLIARLLPKVGLTIENISISNLMEVEMESHTVSQTTMKILKVFLGFMPVIYFSLMFYFTKGRSIGKYFFKIGVVSLYHHRIGFWHCIERSLGYAASFLELGLGIFQGFWNPNRMMLHDKIAETVVVDLKKKK